MTGRTTVTHQGGIWISDGYLKASKGRGVEMRNTAIVTPFTNGGDTTTWKSMDPSLGALRGRLVIVGDSIISTFSSGDELHSGCEFVLKASEREYSARGYVLKNGEKTSSWSVRLERESHPERKR